MGGEMVATGMSATRTGADGMTMMTSRHPTCAALAQPQPPSTLPWLATTATPTTTTPPVTHGVTNASGTPETRDSVASTMTTTSSLRTSAASAPAVSPCRTSALTPTLPSLIPPETPVLGTPTWPATALAGGMMMTSPPTTTAADAVVVPTSSASATLAPLATPGVMAASGTSETRSTAVNTTLRNSSLLPAAPACHSFSPGTSLRTSSLTRLLPRPT